MRIQVDDIEASPKALDYAEEVDDLNARLTCGAGDYRMPAAVAVHVSYYRAGLDLFFEGTARGLVCGRCARCAEDCRGLCPRCGANLNVAGCSCPPATARLTAWSGLRRGS